METIMEDMTMEDGIRTPMMRNVTDILLNVRLQSFKHVKGVMSSWSEAQYIF